jgi:hypothetical protein
LLLSTYPKPNPPAIPASSPIIIAEISITASKN